MHAGASPAFAIIRIPRGEDKPTTEAFLEALRKDRDLLGLPSLNGQTEFVSAGPYAITVDGADLDEYVAWES